MGRINSNAKGKRGERALAQALNSLGFLCRRGQQFAGGQDSPDVVGIPGIHLECKHANQLRLKEWQEQATRDAGANVPVIAHKYDRSGWWLMVPLERALEFCERFKPNV